MDVGCACDVLWMYVMDYVCVLCDAKCLCAVSCIIYEFCVFAFEGKQQTKKIANFPALPSANTGQRSLCRVPGVWHSAKLGKNAVKNSHFLQFCRVPQPGTRQRGQFCRVPDGTTRQRLFLKRFFKKKNCFFAECSALALGKHSNFAECQSLGTRQSRR